MLTIDEIRALNEARTQGNWFVDGYRNWACPGSGEIRSLPIIQSDASPIDIGFMVNGYKSTAHDSAFIAAAPEIAATAIALSEENERLRDLLREIGKDHPGSYISSKIAEALSEATHD